MEQLKSYSFTPQKQFSEALRRYNADPSDDEAGRIVDTVARERMGKTGETYSVALRALSHEARQAASASYGRAEPTRDEWQLANFEIAARSKHLQDALGIGVTQANRLAYRLEPRFARILGYNAEPLTYEQVYGGSMQTRRYGENSPNVRLANIVVGVPRLANGGIDIVAAVDAVNKVASPDDIQKAASDALDVLVRDRIAIEGTPASVVNDPSGNFKADLRRRLRALHRDLGRVEDGAGMNARALREILPGLFK